MSERLSIRAYSRHRGVSDTAVRKAIQSGRITLGDDGRIDPQLADAQWSVNTDAAQQRKAVPQREVPQEAVTSVREALSAAPSPLGGMGASTGASAGGTTLMQAKTANEVLKAQTNKVRLARLKGELVDKDQAVAHVFRMARAERDAWLNWPARVAAQMASALGADSHALHVLLEKAVRDQLTALGDLAVRLE
jgi:hypothetical protein